VLTAAGTGDDGEGEAPRFDPAAAFRDPKTGLRDRAAEVEACEAVLAEAVVEPPVRFESEHALRATAAAAFEAVAAEAGRQTERAYRRLHRLEKLTGHAVRGGGRKALERSLAGLGGADYAALSRLPLWEALLLLGARALEQDLERERREVMG
jgi:hypothetical protein